MSGAILIKKEKIEQWLELKEWNLSKLSTEIKYDLGPLSRVVNGEEEPSKQLMRKLMRITGLGVSLLQYDPNREPKNQSGE